MKKRSAVRLLPGFPAETPYEGCRPKGLVVGHADFTAAVLQVVVVGVELKVYITCALQKLSGVNKIYSSDMGNWLLISNTPLT